MEYNVILWKNNSMKNVSFTLLVTALIFTSNINSDAQSIPIWTKSVSSPLDTAFVFPIRTLNDGSNNIYVLYTYYKSTGPSTFNNKIYLNKYSSMGTLQWNLIYDNNGNGKPRGFDMTIDNSGDCYIAGGFMATLNFQPLLLKVGSAGNVVWDRDSTIAFNTGRYEQLLFKNNQLYLSSASGVASFDLNGNELWSHLISVQRISVDNNGSMIVAGTASGGNNIFRYDATGILNFSDSSVYARRIATDYDNSFYLLTDYGLGGYELAKHDSSGILQWNTNALPIAPPFGDISFDVLVDYNNDLLLLGLSDTIFKFSSTGNLIWRKPMYGLDSYIISAKITFSNILAIAGSVPVTGGYDMSVRMFDLNGNQNWEGYYDGNTSGQEYTVDLTIDNDGIYVVESNADSATLVKFGSPFFNPVNFNLVCVDSVWYDPMNPVFINVRVFNGDVNHLNYPSVQIVSPANDTIGNPSNWVNFFAHLGNTYQIYSDTITQSGITDFSNYTFLIREGFGATTNVINWCSLVAIYAYTESRISIFPNPVSNILYIHNPVNKILYAEIYEVTGKKVFEGRLSSDARSGIDVSDFADGIYFLRMWDGKNLRETKFIKQ